MSGFPTSESIYHRLKSDSTFLPHLAVLSYEDSIKKKMMDIQLTKFIPYDKGGDIPFHRVYYIKYNNEIIWDRKEKICTIDELARNQQEEVLIEGQFRILTFNILNDKYFKGKVNPHRTNEIIEYLVNSHARVICLQEVNPDMAKRFQQEPIKSLYPYQASTSLDDDNIVILSQYTIKNSDTIVLGEHKQGLVVTLHDQVYQQPIHLIGIHLTSTLQSHSEQKRMEQLRIINKYLKLNKIENFVLMGDFNSEIALGYQNTISEAYISYDPTHNSYAKQMSISNLSFCLDRIYISGSILKSLGGRVDNSVVISDHYPVEAQLEISDYVISHQVSHIDQSTALVAIVPVQYWESINEIRRQYDGGADRWMPHVTLAHGFLPLTEVPEFLGADLNLKPLTASMAGVNYFQHEVNQTYYITATKISNNAFQQLYKQLQLYLPNVFNEDYHPHITLGSHPVKAVAPIEWQVDRLHVIAKTDGLDYFKVLHSIPLGNPRPAKVTIEAVVSLLKYFNKEIQWEFGGSAVFDSHNLHDLDLVAFGQVARMEFFTSLKKFLETCGEFYATTLITNSHVSYIKTMYHQDFPVDIHYVTDPKIDQACYSVYNESRQILNCVPNKDVFIEGLRTVKKLARERQVYGTATGFLPGIGWALLCGHFCQKHPAVTSNDFVTEFSRYYANYDYAQPITLNSLSYQKSPTNFTDSLMMLITCTTPKINVLRTMTPSTKQILLETFATGFEEPKIEPQHKLTLSVTAPQHEYQTFYHCWSLLNDLVSKLIIKVNKIVKNIRPYELKYSTQVDEELTLTWSIGYDENSTAVDNYCHRLVQKLKEHFPNLYVKLTNQMVS